MEGIPSVSTRVLLAVDEPGHRRLYLAALEAAGLRVVEATAAGEPAVRAAAARQPEVVVVRAGRPGIEGAKVVGRLREVAPRACLIAVAAAEERPRTRLARRLVADRYVDPHEGPAALVEVLRDLVRERRSGTLAS